MAPSLRSERRRQEASGRKHMKLSLKGWKLFEVGDIDGLMELYADDAELMHPEGWPEPGPTVGRPAIERQFRRLREGWSDYVVTFEEHEGRGDWVVARVRLLGRGSESGADVEVELSAATRFEGDLIVAVHYCWDHADALEAAGWTRDDAGG
jgi:ketosteroid isomerase-like protein